jgi:periplasmic copper chaperone A
MVAICRMGAMLATAGALCAAAALAADAIEVRAAWTPPLARQGGDTPLFMTIVSRADAPDSLVRARCDIADFTEKHTVDRGEGGLAMREVRAIPIPPGQTVTLAPGGYHVMLLHTKQPLAAGDTFACSVVFQKAGEKRIEVKVASEGAPASQ